MCLISSPEGVEFVQKAHPDVDIYVAGIDEKLNEQVLNGEVNEGVQSQGVVDDGVKDQATILKEYEDTLGY